MDLITTQNRDTSLCSDVLLRACPKNDRGSRVNFYIIAFYYASNPGNAGEGNNLRFLKNKKRKAFDLPLFSDSLGIIVIPLENAIDQEEKHFLRYHSTAVCEAIFI